MKNLIKILCLIPLATLLTISCSDWTDVKLKEKDHVGGHNTEDKNSEYYVKLREWKGTAKDYGRPVFFGWFSNWAPSGAARKGYLSALPDSVDMISMWSEPFNLNEPKKKDKKDFQEKKGGKLFVCYILHNIGTGITPASVGEQVQKDNPDASASEINALTKIAQDEYWGFKSKIKGSEDHIAAIKKYANVLLDSIRINDYDGLDIDWEPQNGGDGGLYAGSLKPNRGEPAGKYLQILIEELSKGLGPKSKTSDGKYRYLLLDGEFNNVSAETEPYVDYYVSQAYGNGGSSLNNRVASLKRTFGKNYNTRKHIFTENFESFSQSGGQLLSQAAYNHVDGPKGGVGAFRLDNDYNNSPDYKWVRQAITILHQSYKKYMDDNNNDTQNKE